VGSLPQQVFDGKIDYDVHCETMIAKVVKFFTADNLLNLGEVYISPDLNYLVAPYPITPQDRDQSWLFFDACFKLPSPYAAQLVSLAVRNQENIDSLMRYGFDNQVVQAVLQRTLMAESVSGPMPHRTISDWEYCKDPGYTEFLSPARLLDNSPAILHLKCDNVSEFRGAVFHKDVSGLRPRVLYKSRTHNFQLGEFFTLNDKHGRQLLLVPHLESD
jgi:hypothetical protein